MASKKKAVTAETQQPEPTATLELVVGLGASAGGGEALETFFSTLRESGGIAFVVIPHLDPKEAGHLVGILQQGLPLPVTQVTEAVKMQAGHVYVIPPDRNLRVDDGMLTLGEMNAQQKHAPVDHFFRTLAEAYGGHFVGVFLSGSGERERETARYVEERGGLVFIQAPEEAEAFGGPPHPPARGAGRVLRRDMIIAHIAVHQGRLREKALHEAKVYAESIVETLHEPLLVLHPDLRVRSANPAFYEHFEVRPEETIGQVIYDLGNGQWDIPALRTLLEDVLPDSKVFNDFEVTHTFEQIGRRVMLVNARRLDHVQLILLGIRDNTERKRNEEQLRELNQTLEQRVEERTQQVRDLTLRLTMAEQEERERIAQVLHDDLQQLLYGLWIPLSLLKTQQAADRLGLVAQAEQILEDAMALTRSLSTELYPPVLKGEGLRALLEWLAIRKQERFGLKVAIVMHDEGAVADRALRVLLYQVLRELLFNVVKHAGTSEARMEAWTENGEVIVEVADEGKGFDLAALRANQAGGLGLMSIEERLSLVGGRFEVEAAPGQGCRVRVAVPAHRAALSPPPDSPSASG